MQLAIDEIVRQGLMFNLRRRSSEVPSQATIRLLFQMLADAHIKYTLVGGVALLSYIEGRNTQDVDLIIDPKDALESRSS